MATIRLSGPAPRQYILPAASARPALRSVAVSRTWSPEQNKTMISCLSICSKRTASVHKHVCNHRWRIMSLPSNSEKQPSSVLLSHTMEEFYDCVNDKNLKKLNDFISDDCCFDDLTFLQPFQGRKEVMKFFEQLLHCTGNNVKFIIESVCEGDNFAAVVMWHLEWEDKRIPFTRGCSFYECSKQGERLVIKKAQVLTESPIKPGVLALMLLKNVSFLFDEFPEATEGFLNKPYEVLRWLLNMYNIFLEPFIRPVIAWYINFWKCVVIMLSYTLVTVIKILKRLKIFLK